jgi:hypothetical protein
MAVPNAVAWGPELAAIHYLVSEAKGYRSRESIVLSSTIDAIVARGTILGKRTKGTAAAVTPAAFAHNAGNATVGAVTVDAGATAGTYKAIFTTATTFNFYNPAGILEGGGSTGVAFSAGSLNFTITAGGTPMVAGNGFNFPLAYAAGSLEWVPWTPAATDGSEAASGIAYDNYDVTGGVDVPATAHVRECEVQRASLAFVGTPTQPEKDAAYAALALNQIIFR